MPAILANARHFQLTTDFPVDQVVYLRSASQVMDGSTYFQFAHGLPFTPLVELTWSYNSNFATTYPENTGPAPSSPGYIFDMQITCSADAQNIYINCYGPAPAQTVYYRIFGFQPSDSNVDMPPTADAGSSFILNTDQNLPKLFEAGVRSFSAGAVSISILHNLGFIPQVRVWREGSRTALIDVVGPMVWMIDVTTTSLNMVSDELGAGRLHYRIYADE